MKLVKKEVSYSTYYILYTLFYTLIFLGLLWQVTQISVKYFIFDVIKDINVIMPEEMNQTHIRYNICFQSIQVLKEAEYLEAYLNRESVDLDLFDTDLGGEKQTRSKAVADFNLGTRLRTSVDESIFKSIETIEKFILGDYTCFQIKGKYSFTIDGPSINGVLHVLISVGESLPDFDYKRLIRATASRMNESFRGYEIFYGMFDIRRLQYPYVEECTSYRDLSSFSRTKAIADCLNEFQLKKYQRLSKHRAFSALDERFFNYSLELSDTSRPSVSLENEFCNDKFPSFDCEQRDYFTKLTEMLGYSRDMYIDMEKPTEPSFHIESKPRIDTIDFVTYIFGALGSWIGFTFLDLNPFPWFIQKPGNNSHDKNLVESTSNQSNDQSINDLVTKSELTDQERKIITLVNRFDRSNTQRFRYLLRRIDSLNTVDQS